MEKSLTLLSILIICGTAISSVIAASLNEKPEIEDKVFNLRTEHNFKNLSRYKRNREYDTPDVSALLKRLINEEVRRYHKQETGQLLKPEDVVIDLNIKIASIQEFVPRGVEESAPELVATDATILENYDDTLQHLSTGEITLKTVVTETSTIGNTLDFSGEMEIASIPILGPKGKFAFKFSKTQSTTSTKTEEISKKLPSQKITLEPRSSKTVVSELYTSNIISNNVVSFKMDASSTYTLQFKGFNSEVAKPRVRNLRSGLEAYMKSYDLRYPTAMYCGIVPCVEFKDNNVYLKYYPFQTKAVKTELFSHVEKL